MVDESMQDSEVATFDFRVERGKIREFATAIGNPHPLHVSPAFARSAGYSDVIMPITFPATFPFHIGIEDAVVNIMRLLKMNPKTSVHGEVEFVQHRAVSAGETLRCVVRVGRIYSKERQAGGKMTFVELALSFFAGDNELVYEMKNVFIEKSS